MPAKKQTNPAADKSASVTARYVRKTFAEKREYADVDFLNLDPVAVDRSPFQPRMDFPKEEIEQLAELIRTQGQLVPIIVRPGIAGRFELVDGERRLRAVKAAGLTTIRAECRKLADAEARAIILVSSIAKKDLNPIEEAWAFQAAIQSGDVKGPTELAKQLGVSQGYVSNRIRLLELPERWAEIVISREITERHARAVLPYKNCPSIMEAIEQALGAAVQESGEAPSVSTWECVILPDILRKHSRTMDGNGDGEIFDMKRGRHVKLFTPSDEDATALGIVELAGERRAINTKLWDELQEAFLSAQDKAAPESPSHDGFETSFETDAVLEQDEGEDNDLPAAEVDSRDSEVKPVPPPVPDHPSPSAKDFPGRLWAWTLMAKRKAVAAHISKPAYQTDLIKLAALAMCRWYRGDLYEEDLVTALRLVGIKRVKDPVRDTLGLEEWDLDKVLGSLVAHYFWDENGPVGDVPEDELCCIADYLAIELRDEWQAGNIASPQGYWELHTKEQLLAIAKEVKLLTFLSPHNDCQNFTPTDLAKMGKSDLVCTFMKAMPIPDGAEAGIPMPKEIIKAKPPKK